ncbi:MAG: hypothetical protein WAU02_00370 [Candidatus Saccharimonadales bacterium]
MVKNSWQKPLNRIYSYWGVLGNAFTIGLILGMIVLFAGSLFGPITQGDTQEYLTVQPDSFWRSQAMLNSLFAVPFVIALYFMYDTYRKKRAVSARPVTVSQLAKNQQYQYAYEATNQIRSKNFMLIPQRDAKVTNCMSCDDWIYGELSYNIYQHTRYGDYVSETVYYSLLEVPLPRKLPNMFFDGFKAHGRQFHWLIDSEQITSLEGDFDNYFITYFPEQYHIDARSIISPEVMQAMIDIYPADIEIYGNSLYIYSPLLPTSDITSFTQKALKIRDVMMDHSQYYHDSLADSGDRSTVSVYGASLNKRNVFPWASLIFAVVILWAIFSQAPLEELLSPKILTIIVVWGGVAGYEIVTWYRARAKLKRKRQQLYQKVGKLRAKNIR